MTQQQLADKKRDLEAQELQRKHTLKKWQDYLSFWTSKVAGLGSLVAGGLDVVNPSIIPHLPHPEMLLGGGLALFAGKSVLSLVAKWAQAAGGG